MTRAASLKLAEIASIRSVVGDGHSDESLRLLLAQNGGSVYVGLAAMNHRRAPPTADVPLPPLTCPTHRISWS